MPRPKKNPDALYVRELRITPSDDLPITEWKISDKDFKIAIFAEEGGPGTDKRLHYHGYVESHRSESWIKKWIYSIAHCYNGEQGNAVFFSRQPHDNTIGYVVKHANVTVRHGVSQTYITEWIVKSKQYRTDKESARKRKQRSRDDDLMNVFKQVEKDLKDRSITTDVNDIVARILAICHNESIRFPARSQMDNLVLKLVYPYNESLVRSFYTRSYEVRY